MKKFSLIFLIIIIVMLGVYIYTATRQGSFLFFGKDATESSSRQAHSTGDQQARVLSSFSVALVEQNDSGEFGSAEFTAEAGSTKVLSVLAGESVGTRNAVMHKGLCTQLGETAYSLAQFEAGVSEMVLPISLNNLFSQFPLAFVVRDASDPNQRIVACGDLAQ